jgi:hypothetical protein
VGQNLKRKVAACPNSFLSAIALPYKPWHPLYTFPIGRETNQQANTMNEKTDVWQGTLALMVLKTLEALGPQHGFGIARRIEQISDNKLAINYGTIYPALVKLEQEGYIKG